MEGKTDNEYMALALQAAREAKEADEVPVGAVIVFRGEVLAVSGNRRERDKRATHHAEMQVIDEACRRLGGWRLPECTLFVTLEPCPMCAGAIVNARIPRVVFGAYDARAGFFGSLLDINALPLNHKCEVTGGVCEEECKALLTDYFKEKRTRKKDGAVFIPSVKN